MNQINVQKKLGLSLSYFFLGLYLTAEPFFLKLFFETYLPDFNYRALTLPISAVVLIAGFKKLQDATGNNDLRKIIVAVQTEFTNWQNPQFRRRILSRYTPRLRYISCLFKGFSSEEPMARKRSTRVVVCLCLTAVYLYCLLFYLPHLFLINLSRWGRYETSLTISAYAIPLFLIIITSYPVIVDEITQIKNALRSAADLENISKILREELQYWQIEKRIVLAKNLNSSQQKKTYVSLILRLFEQKKRDIDIIAISPNNNYFVIELKSHLGNVKWNSKLGRLCQQLGRNPEYVPFKKDFIAQVKTQADKFKKHHNLTHRPNKILLFSRARVKHDRARGKRVKSDVLISYPSQLINDLRERNQEQIEKKNARNANSRRP